MKLGFCLSQVQVLLMQIKKKKKKRDFFCTSKIQKHLFNGCASFCTQVFTHQCHQCESVTVDDVFKYLTRQKAPFLSSHT